jgi:hypothetical protein
VNPAILEGRAVLVDNRIRKNEVCVINLPSCGYVFSSSPSCFIAYDFSGSTLEMEILSALLSERRIEPHEAGGSLAPGSQVFCQKICSKIIQSQFCIVLLNCEAAGGVQRSNANVHMEYGLMLGFNKYVLPFQREDLRLEFNVAGLDTVKYNSKSFKTKAANAIDLAILQTTQKSPVTSVDPDVGAYLLERGSIITTNDDIGEKNIYQLGAVCGFNLCVDLTGNRYRYFGNFPKLGPPAIAWRVKKLIEIWTERLKGTQFKIDRGISTTQNRDLILELYQTMEVWILVGSESDRQATLSLLDGCSATLSVFTVADVSKVVSQSGMF